MATSSYSFAVTLYAGLLGQ